MTISSHPLLDLSEIVADWPDEVVDLSDRRRLLVRAIFGVDLTAAAAEAMFAPGQSSTTRRSDGRSSSTDDR